MILNLMHSWHKIQPSLEMSFLMWLWIKTHWLLPAKDWDKTQCPCFMQRLQIDHYSPEHLVGLRIENVFPNLQPKCSHGPLLPICSHASIVLWLQPLPARWEQRKLGRVLFLGCSSGQQSCSCTEEGRVASNACSSLAVWIFQSFCVFLTHDCGVEY